MNAREARNEGLVEISAYNFPEFSGHSSYKEQLKEKIKETRKKYGVKIVMVPYQSGSGFSKYFSNKAFAEPILIDYLMLERANEDTTILENKRAELEAEYQAKRDDLEGRFISLRTKLAVAANNVEMHKKVLKVNE